MLTKNTPNDWKELQNITGKILTECGFSVSVEKKVSSVRGTIEIDVFAIETIMGRENKIICECKYWKNRVPQSVIHSFRTIIGDIGANTGYIISLNGFQKGALKAIENTNIRILNWEEFQGIFEKTWYQNYFQPMLEKELDPLFSYTEPFLLKLFEELSEDNRQKYMELKKKYDIWGFMLMPFTSYLTMHLQERRIGLPLRNHIKNNEEIATVPDALLDEIGYRDFLDLVIIEGTKIIEMFRQYKRIAIDNLIE